MSTEEKAENICRSIGIAMYVQKEDADMQKENRVGTRKEAGRRKPGKKTEEMCIRDRGREDAQIILGLEEDAEYKIYIDDVNAGTMTTQLGGKLVPVSYTHLDVYKRQVVYGAYLPADC